MHDINIKSLLLRFKGRVLFTFSLVLVESALEIFYPLLIGLAINDLLAGSYNGVMYLGGLGLVTLLVGSARRFYDTRIYAGIYCEITPEMVEKEQKRDSSVSKISARAGLLTEFVEFLENSMPEVIGAIISLVGILAIIAGLSLNVFYACIALLLLIFLVYSLSGKVNFRLNAGYNNRLEKQVEALETKNLGLINNHFKSLMNWNIKLSDLETVNFIAIWIGVIALFVYTPITVIESKILNYGLVFSILMYVFEYIDKMITFPLYIQQLIRLNEISKRLADS